MREIKKVYINNSGEREGKESQRGGANNAKYNAS